MLNFFYHKNHGTIFIYNYFELSLIYFFFLFSPEIKNFNYFLITF